jgi:hypothetical protein
MDDADDMKSQNKVKTLRSFQWTCPNGLMKLGGLSVLLGILLAFSCSTLPENSSDPMSLQADERFIRWEQGNAGGDRANQYYKLLWSPSPGLSYPPARDNIQVWVFNHDQELEAWIPPFSGSGTYYVRVALVENDTVLEYSQEITTGLIAPEPDPPAGPEGPRIEITLEKNLLTFIPYGEFPQGFKVLWSKDPDPQYPPRDGDYANYVGPYDLRETWLWTDKKEEEEADEYYIRVVEYLGEEGIGTIEARITADLSD